MKPPQVMIKEICMDDLLNQKYNDHDRTQTCQHYVQISNLNNRHLQSELLGKVMNFPKSSSIQWFYEKATLIIELTATTKTEISRHRLDAYAPSIR
jgi:hypothetical protein